MATAHYKHNCATYLNRTDAGCLARTLQVQVTLLRQSYEELKEARQESARKSREVDVERRKAQMLQEALHKEQQKLQSAIRENETLSTLIGKLRKELEELRSSHQVTGSNQSIN